MDTDLRASLVASGVAAVLSMVVGIVSGVEFLPLLLRALLGGLVFGGIVFGGFLVLHRFLPELFGEEEEGEPVLGGNVDIVLPGEGPEAIESESDDETVVEEADMPPVPKRNLAAATVADREARLPLSAGRDRGDEEAEDLSPYAGESLIDGVDSDNEDPIAAAAAATRPQTPRSPESLDDLDVLPDLESLSDSFSSMSPGADGTPVHEYSDSDHRSKGAGGRGGDADPAVLAQAVRTLLKRDQER